MLDYTLVFQLEAFLKCLFFQWVTKNETLINTYVDKTVWVKTVHKSENKSLEASSDHVV